MKNAIFKLLVAASVVSPAVVSAEAGKAPTTATYIITATAVGQQANDTACATFTINSAGQQSATGTDPNASVDCWQN